jgi:DNA-binding response OmpR family regulator
MTTRTSPRPPPRVLFIHDGDPVDGHVKYLSDAGLTVREAEPRDAVSSALSFDPHIVVLDFRIDGEVVAALQAVEATKHIPVIALADLAKTSRDSGSA